MVPRGWTEDGKALVSLTDAAAHLRLGRGRVERLVAAGTLRVATCARREAPSEPRSGRRPTKFVVADDVVAERDRMLEALGAVDESVATERDTLVRRVADLEAGAVTTGGSASELAEVRDRERRLAAAVEAGLAAQRAQLDQISALLLPTGVWQPDVAALGASAERGTGDEGAP